MRYPNTVFSRVKWFSTLPINGGLISAREERIFEFQKYVLRMLDGTEVQMPPRFRTADFAIGGPEGGVRTSSNSPTEPPERRTQHGPMTL